MNLQERKALLVKLGTFMQSTDTGWLAAREKATAQNPWFLPSFIELSVAAICREFLMADKLQAVIDRYHLADNHQPKKIGLVMAGNIPLVGFHDLLCIFLTGHYAVIKPSSKDEVLMTFLVEKLQALDGGATPYFTISERLNNCDAYIATGSNNSALYFEQYFGKYPHIIRKNRTSVAILTGQESAGELSALADDVYLYFGLGCRNVTKLYVPQGYAFEPLLEQLKKYNYLFDHHKYRNNYDYNLTIHLLNKRYFMSDGSLLLVEDSSPFSPISQLNYAYYDDAATLAEQLRADEAIQCIVGRGHTAFGQAQQPGLCDFADGVDTFAFLKGV